MPGNSYFLSLIYSINKFKKTTVPIKYVEEGLLSPTTKESMRKIRSTEDFMKHQVPWIL